MLASSVFTPPPLEKDRDLFIVSGQLRRHDDPIAELACARDRRPELALAGDSRPPATADAECRPAARAGLRRRVGGAVRLNVQAADLPGFVGLSFRPRSRVVGMLTRPGRAGCRYRSGTLPRADRRSESAPEAPPNTRSGLSADVVVEVLGLAEPRAAHKGGRNLEEEPAREERPPWPQVARRARARETGAAWPA